MSKTVVKKENYLEPETKVKAEKYEPMADWLLKSGRRMAHAETDFGKSYEELSAYEKFEALTDLYNHQRDMQIEDNPPEYTTAEMIDYVESIMEAPCPEREVDTEKLDEVPEELEAETRSVHRTGDPEMRKVVRELEGGEMRGIFTERID